LDFGSARNPPSKVAKRGSADILVVLIPDGSPANCSSKSSKEADPSTTVRGEPLLFNSSQLSTNPTLHRLLTPPLLSPVSLPSPLPPMSSPLLLLLLTLPLLASSFLLPPSLPPPTFLGAAKFKSFDDMLQTYPQPVLVDFFATWCGPCQLMSKELAAVADDMKDIVKVAKGESVFACLFLPPSRERRERNSVLAFSRAFVSLSLLSNPLSLPFS